jgi:Fe-S cluster assembly iron-binding protein IscA
LGLALDELKENEETIHVNGIDVLISDMVRPYTDGNKVDYIQSIDGEGFIVGKPGQTGCEGCSC